MNSKYRGTEHSEMRQQQRGISTLETELIDLYGEDHFSNGCRVTTLNKRAIRKIKKDLKYVLQHLEKLQDEYLVIDGDQLVTVAHRTKRWFKN